jgi:hypothetical protein
MALTDWKYRLLPPEMGAKKIFEKRGLTPRHGLRYKGGLVGLGILEIVYFQYVPHPLMLPTGLHNLGTNPRTAQKSESFRLSTVVEKYVDNLRAALGAGRTHRDPD